MTFKHLILSLPIEDRQTAHDFYRNALGLKPIGAIVSEPAKKV